jgi:hypothetical protein
MMDPNDLSSDSDSANAQAFPSRGIDNSTPVNQKEQEQQIFEAMLKSNTQDLKNLGASTSLMDMQAFPYLAQLNSSQIQPNPH